MGLKKPSMAAVPPSFPTNHNMTTEVNDMATDRYPNQNTRMPMNPRAVEAARARTVQGKPSPAPEPMNGNGSVREIRPGEWIDDRRNVIGGPASPSKDSPPELPEARDTPPASYDPTKVYQITLGKPAVHAGRTLAPGKTYLIVGASCTEIAASVIDAVEIGDIPADPDVQPSAKA